jgi:myosin-crossreactive antigen
LLSDARSRKMEKYEEIVKEAKAWLERNKDEIAYKYKVSKIEVDCSYIIISNLGMVPKRTEIDL